MSALRFTQSSQRRIATLLLLYTLGDLRAQGLLQKKAWWHLGLFLVGVALTMIMLVRATQTILSTPTQPGSTLLAVVALSVGLLLFINGLSVGILSKTAGKEEFIRNKFLPVHAKELISLRIFLGILRAETVTLFLIPSYITAVFLSHASFLLSIEGLITLLTFPLVPALLGIQLNLRESQPNLLIWFSLLLGVFFVGTGLSQQYPVPPTALAFISTVINLPVRGVLLQATPLDLLLFNLVWIGCTLGLVQGTLQMIGQVHEADVEKQQGSWLQQSMTRSFPWHDHPFVALCALACDRLKLSIILAGGAFQIASTYLMLHSVTGKVALPLPLVAGMLCLESFVAMLVSFGLLITATLGNPKEHQVLSYYPLSARMQAGAVYSVALLVYLGIITGTGILCGILLHSILTLWFCLFLFSSALGAGSLLLTIMLKRRYMLQLLLWSTLLFPYFLLKLIGILIGLLLFPTQSFFGICLCGILLDALVTAGLWKWLLPRHYTHFVEEI